jgi:superfamily II DNA or RNA helicase
VVLDALNMLIPEQDSALNLAISGHNFCLVGQAGTGKTYILIEILKRCRAMGHIVAMTATTGIACSQFPKHCQAMTIHRYTHSIDLRTHRRV